MRDKRGLKIIWLCQGHSEVGCNVDHLEDVLTICKYEGDSSGTIFGRLGYQSGSIKIVSTIISRIRPQGMRG